MKHETNLPGVTEPVGVPAPPGTTAPPGLIVPGIFVAVDGVRLHVVVSGTGPPVMLCGGLGSNWFDWDDTVRILSASNTVVVFDRPGFGLSESLPEEQTPTIRGETSRILGVLDALGITEPVVIAGHSIAGFYVEAFARLHPTRARGVLLIDSSAERDPRSIVPIKWRVVLAHLTGRVMSRSGLQAAMGTTTRRILNQSIPPDGTTQETFDWVRQIYRSPSFLLAALIEDAVYPDMGIELNHIRRSVPKPDIPFTVAVAFTGRKSPWARHWLAKQKRLANYLTAQYVVVAPAHHHAMIDQPEEIATLITRLL